VRYAPSARPTIGLEGLLRRRRTNLSSFLKESGITTYELLGERCSRMGVSPPTKEAFAKAMGPHHDWTSSPTEGVVVVDSPPNTISEATGETVDDLPLSLDPHPDDRLPKRRRRVG